MAKDKLFTPEDFDKEPRTSKKNYLKWIIISVIVLHVIIAIILGLKCSGSDNKSQTPEVVTTNVTEMQDSVITSEVVEKQDSIYSDAQLVNESTFENNTTKDSSISKSYSEQVAEPIVTTDDVSNVETEAIKVIRGDYGNNPERKKILGTNYQSIQNRVNELKRQGAF